MNCFEFKRLALTDPYSEEKSFVVHGEECNDCGQHLVNILAMDNTLRDALSVKAPEDLKARLKLRQVIEKEQVKHRNFRRFAYAASTLLAVGLVFFGYQNHQLTERYTALHDAAVGHMAYEQVSFTSVQPTAQSRMKAHLASLVGMNVGELPGLRYSQLCPINGKDTWHAVMETKEGDLVTVIFFKGAQLPNKSLQKNGWDSKVIDSDRGDIMLIGKSGMALESAEKQLDYHISI